MLSKRTGNIAEIIARPVISTLRKLEEEEAACTRCPLYKYATQVVPGKGPKSAKIMLVGEQPGNEEDLRGLPFVGPAGRVLDKALAAAPIDRRSVFVTNAVKHFKFEERGKRRLHKRPNTYEIDRCRWWNDYERKIVKPKLIVALGATAARSLLQKPIVISRARRELFNLEGATLTVTSHPSSILRLRESESREAAFRALVQDLRFGLRALR